mgnify:FL=1
MGYYIVKIFVSALLIVAISEIAKRHSALAALLAALPVTTLLAFIWMYLETGKIEPIAALSGQVFWLVIPSLALFLSLPVFLSRGWGFWPSLLASCALTSGTYLLMLPLLHRLGIAL